MSDGQASSAGGQRGRLVTGAAWMGGARIFNGFVSFFSTVALARLLSPDDFGIIAIAWAVVAIIATLGELSLRQALIHVEELEDGHFDTAFTLSLMRAFILAAIVGGAAWPVAAFYGDDRLVGILLVFAVTAALTGMTSPRFTLLQRALDFRGEVALSIADKLAAFVAAVGIAYFTGSYYALALGVLAAQLVRLPLSYIIKPYRPRISLSHYKDLLSFSIWITLGTFVKTLNGRAEPLLLGSLVPTQKLGQYAIADRVAGLVSRELLIPISAILFPAFSRIRSNPERLRAAYLEAQGVLILAVLPVTVGLALIADPVVRIILGDQWVAAVPYVQILALTYAVEMLQSIQPIGMATGNTKAIFLRDVRSLLIRLPLLVIGIAIAIVNNGDIIAGALIGGASGMLINSFLNMRLISRFTLITILDHLGLALRPFLGVVAMSVVVLCVAQVLPPYYNGRQAMVTASILAGAGSATYFATLAMTWAAMGKPRGAETHAAEILVQRVPIINRLFG